MFVEFWRDEKDQHTCCLFATDDELDEADVFDCETCPVSAALAALWPENADAWRRFHVIASRFVGDLYAGSEALRRLTADVDDDEFPDLLARLSLIYDALYPPQKRES